MRFLADENIARDLISWLRETGHDVAWVDEQSSGISDEAILAQCVQEGRIILSADLDFGELIIRRQVQAPGVLLLRMETRQSEEILRIIQLHWEQIHPVLTGHFVVLTPRRLRIRPLHY